MINSCNALFKSISHKTNGLYTFLCAKANDCGILKIILPEFYFEKLKNLSLCCQCVYVDSKGTIHPGLRLLPSGNFFLALNRSHHFLLIKVSMYLILQVEHNASNLITLLYILSIFSIVKLSK